MKKLGLILLFITVSDSICMEAPEAAKSQEITITSSDGTEFKAPKEVAEKSVTIKNMLSETGSDQVPLSNVDAATLDLFLNVAQEDIKNKDKKDKELFTILEKQLPPLVFEEGLLIKSLGWSDLPKPKPNLDLYIKVLKAANYLDYQMLLDVATSKLVKSPRVNIENLLANIPRDLHPLLAKHLAKNLPSNWQTIIPASFKPLVAKYYYLITGANLAGVDPKSYGFSIRELMDYNRLPRSIFGAEFDLSSMRINDLNGLNEIPGITNLENLNLRNNQLSSLPADVFNELTGLQRLNLSGNQLSSLPVGVFNGLTSLKTLNLSENQLSSLPVGMFNGLTSLQELWLSYNQLSSLPVGVFNGLTNLKKLYLSENQLSSLPVGMFNGLTSLKMLDLSYNQLSSLPAGVFNSLTNLWELYLFDNKFSKAEKKRIRDEVPANVEITF